ncbi:DUF2339 domain-containing protein [Pedobacter immunditicola]|uniref:DUF2339 domain-containing protein n=1 Tax=Pedobacter immunditicola TaxID=3133440 RepID=UPI0030A0F39F
MNHSDKLGSLLLQLENLQVRQEGFGAEIKALKVEIRNIQSLLSADADPIQQSTPVPAPVQKAAVAAQPSFSAQFSRKNMGKSDFEKFVGENLISKIGILILIIGVGIGAKYAIDHDMVSPLTRIILGYFVGAALLGFAIKLKAKYENYSAVLISGAIAILYFITYAAYDLYSLMPQSLTFATMVVFTAFAVIAATQYNKQVIAHIGLVGAYGVPFLLSDGSGNVLVLFSYMAIINIGILIVSFKRYWKPLLYVSFGLSWLIFLGWALSAPNSGDYFSIGLAFSTVFFLVFYVSSLAYKISKAENFDLGDVTLILLNAFIYYGIGYFILQSHTTGAQLLGLFTLGNAIIHFMVSLVIYKKKLADKKIFYLILAMVITFITMAVPVQLDGGYVTVLWTVEAALLFYLGRIRNIAIYEKLSLPLIILAFGSLLHDWQNYDTYTYSEEIVRPLLNVDFLTACIFIAAFAWMYQISKTVNDNPEKSVRIESMLTYLIPAILLVAAYMTFRLEIVKYFDGLLVKTQIKIETAGATNYPIRRFNFDYELLKTACIYIYTLFFAALLTVANLKKIKLETLATVCMVINLVVLLAFLTQGLYYLSMLRDNYLFQNNEFFTSGGINIGIRYVSLAFFALLLFQCYHLSRSGLLKRKVKNGFDYVLYISLLWILSSELINIISLQRLSGSYKLGLSILWGLYALFLIIMGLAKKKKHLRIGAITLFAVTLAKLFLYDIGHLNTIAKTIVFVSLGVLLLLISFLYNKYKHLITDDAEIKD